MAVPKYDDLFQPLLNAIHSLGGSAAMNELVDKVAEILNLSDEDVNELHNTANGGKTTKLRYRLGWAKYYLKKYGLLESSERGVWRLTTEGQKIKLVDQKEVIKFVSEKYRKAKSQLEEQITEENGEANWEEVLINKVMELSPQSFEMLCQRILRESGFIQVEVTGKSGDGGIDGKGILKLNGLMSFHIIFQCKRYTNSVTSKEIRDFRGAMQGRADKGLFMTTSTFTRDARQEATRDGAPPIDLIDGNSLAEKMKELGLGVNIKIVEEIMLDNSFFEDYK